jgi:hypothetical protein
VRASFVAAVALLVALACVLAGGRVFADDESPRARALRLVEQAEHDDEALELGRAAGEYEEALRIDPASPKAMRAEERAKTLRAHAEGDFAPYAALERVRRSPALASDPHAVDELVRAADGFPPGLVRIDVWVFAAEAYAQRLGRPDEATRLWRRVADDPHADPIAARAAIGALVEQALGRGDLAAAEADAARPLADDRTVSSVRRFARRRFVHRVAVASVGGVVLFAAIAIARAAQRGRLRAIVAAGRRSSRLIAVSAAYLAIAGGLLAASYEDTSATPFLLLGVVLAPILFLARAWGAAGSPAPRARAARAAACAASALGAAFLVLEHVDASYLEGLGL